MEENVLQELQLHQNNTKRDSGSPLFLIREKEMEISGRVLAAKQEAERIVAEGRRKAAEIISKAEAEADKLGREHETKLMEDAEVAARSRRALVGEELAPLEATIIERKKEAVAAVVEMVTEV